MNLPQTLLTAALTLGLTSGAMAAEPEQCQKVRFSDVGWTDITATTAMASEILDNLGYQPQTQLLSVPVTFRGMHDGDLDVFLGNWMPSMENDIRPYLDKQSLDVHATNLTGAKYTLAVPAYVYDAGVKTFADLAKHAEQFDSSIYGIEPGNDGNRLISDMIKANAFGLEDFRLVESSEAGMLAQTKRAIRRNDWIVFLGWAPHPMNQYFDMRYLDGGDDWFGPNFGGAEVHTVVRKGYAAECPNVGKLLSNLQFTVAQENAWMAAILDEDLDPREAAKQWLKANPQTLEAWLNNVTTFDGQPALPTVKGKLAL
ncbi:glycine betaine/proline transport system substrate-binding protein [Atopomonas hussainii]|uniref:Glycine betaine/proline transport system substrate-binding protein n=1 Tax=Atopomonas hussainii TaxID=1429083 RepID=A0A1H7N2W1_9GAMM|nr:choline ABC transporter substrate-binding protein [Atopomonas hussainii]SEL17651.1 glycine betaine/proline transport system substrate-binding protein [Atopomonas hussainii]